MFKQFFWKIFLCVVPVLIAGAAVADAFNHDRFKLGGDAEERAGAYIEQHVTKPVVGYVAGFTAPEGKTMGHAGAIISGSSGTAQAKKEALEKAGVRVGKTPSETAALVRDIMK